ncbi:hypothetical protein LJB98_03295 [Bacteroidales bacterium OttesenSCG-928-M11]|nr:hypothetical protein [Bacteroidales bacterium OttesenSCG-928-M11]
MQGKKTGGRKKGTPNKSTMLGKSSIVELLNDYSNSGLMSSDFKILDPKDRLYIAEKLMQYVMPKMQSTSLNFDDSEKGKTIEDTLSKLAEEET